MMPGPAALAQAFANEISAPTVSDILTDIDQIDWR
jgi:hypothetical protein